MLKCLKRNTIFIYYIFFNESILSENLLIHFFVNDVFTRYELSFYNVRKESIQRLIT